MELKVSIDGLERSVSGVSETTTCSQIIYALAHATSQRGRFVMVEKYRNVERRLAPNDRPLETLKKWREHATNVTFQMLRVDNNDQVCNRVEEPLDSQFMNRQNASTSSVVSSLPGRSSVAAAATAGQQPQLENGQQRSTSSLPAYSVGGGVTSTGTLGRRRPPPPDYNSVMEQKNAIMSKSLYATPNDTSFSKMSDYQSFNKEEATEYIAYEEELRQLLTQQKNLRTILQPMIAANWPQKYQQEVKKSHKLRASIEATREAIDKTKKDIFLIESKEQELIEKIQTFQKEDASSSDNSDFLETSIDLTSSPPKVVA